MAFKLVLYLGIMTIGIIIGYIEISHKKLLDSLDKLQFLALLILLFTMGIRIGADEIVIKSIGTLGKQALVLSVSSIITSMILIYLYRQIKKINKSGDKI